MSISNRLLWLFIGGVVLPTLLLAYLGISASLERQELAELRLQQAQQREVQAVAGRISRWVEGQAEGVLEGVRDEVELGRDGEVKAESLMRLKEWYPLIRQLFVIDRKGRLRWPTLPRPPLSHSLSWPRKEAHPTALGLAHLSLADSSFSQDGHPSQARYQAALETFRALLGQSDPWLRAVALDLIARSYVQLEQWEKALTAYRQLVEEFGTVVDAAGLPIELGAQYEIAYIYGRLGQQRQLVENYLEVYGNLVDRRLPLPEEQRTYLQRLTRQALTEFLQKASSIPAELVERFEDLRAREEAQEQREQFLRQLWQQGVVEEIISAAQRPGVQGLVRETDGQVMLFFWMGVEGGYFLGFQVAPAVLAGELAASGLLGGEGDLGVYVATAGGEAVAGAVSPGVVAAEAGVAAMPPWKVVGMARREESDSRIAFLYVWLAGLAALGLAGGIYGVARTVRGRLQTAQLQADFVSGVSHELRTPLTSIRLFSEMLLEERARTAAQQRSFVETIHRECRRLEHLVHHVLTFAQAEKGRLVCQFTEVDMEELVRAAVRGFAPFAVREEIHIQTSIPAGLPPVWADADRMESVIFDLLDNAARYGGAGRRIDVALFARNGALVLEVADQGPGVPADERCRIFRAFFRGREGLRQGKAGTGLGLTLAQRIVLAHGGKVDMRPGEDGGSVFAVELPAREECGGVEE